MSDKHRLAIGILDAGIEACRTRLILQRRKLHKLQRELQSDEETLAALEESRLSLEVS